jgi:hypothetical protein
MKFSFALLILAGLCLNMTGQELTIRENGVIIEFDLLKGKHLRQILIHPEGAQVVKDLRSDAADVNLEVAVHCTGETYSGITLVDCQPSMRLEYAGMEQSNTLKGKDITFTQYDPVLKLKVQSVYEFFDGTSAFRKYTRLINESKKIYRN